MPAPPPSSNYDDYRQCISEQLKLKPAEWTFKSDKRYQRILEHVFQGEAEGFWHKTKSEFANLPIRSLLQGIAQVNDQFGKPPFLTIDGLSCGASNWQYFYHGLKLWEYIEKLKLPEVHIIELGAGFGGQAVHSMYLAKFFKTQLIGYTMVDVAEAAALQNAYTQALYLPAKAYDGLDSHQLKKALWQEPRIVFSAYGFSEFDEAAQTWYSDHLLDKCDHGFLVWNYAPNWPHRSPNVIYQFVNKPIQVDTDVQPFTTDNISYVYF